MAKVQYFTACTMDGFIADEHNSLDWLFESPHGEDDGTWDEFIGGVGSMAMGATTYEWVLQQHDMLQDPQQWRDFYEDRPCWVFTHRDLPAIPGVDIRFASGDVRPVHEEMAAALPGRNIWLVGGGDLVGQFDDAGLLDEVWLGMRPVFLGRGAPLLPRRITSERLRFRDVRYGGTDIRVVLEVARRP